MNTFKLIGKRTKEQINKTEAQTLEEAVQYFAKVKNLKPEMLLSIYDVKKDK